jgi:hypothetical protein
VLFYEAEKRAKGQGLEKCILKTHLDIDIATDKAGVATVMVALPLIHKLLFKNIASNDGIAMYGK